MQAATKNKIYMDYAASAPMLPEVIKAMHHTMSAGAMNPMSLHAMGRAGYKIIDDAREFITKNLGASGYDCVFTSGATEANNLAINGLKEYKLVTSAIEHPSVIKCTTPAAMVPVDSNCRVIPSQLQEILERVTGEHKNILVSIMAANNETGVIQPISKLSKIAKKFGALLHTDLTQCVGKMPINLTDMGVDMASISAHKFGGPQGCGALIYRPGITLTPILHGGGQEKGLRAGTHNVAAIYGMHKALELSTLYPADSIRKKLQHIENAIKESAPDAIVAGENAERLPNICSVSTPGLNNHAQLIALDARGIMVGIGSACSSGTIKRSHVLQAMSMCTEHIDSNIRISIGPQNTTQEIEKFISEWFSIYNSHRNN